MRICMHGSKLCWQYACCAGDTTPAVALAQACMSYCCTVHSNTSRPLSGLHIFIWCLDVTAISSPLVRHHCRCVSCCVAVQLVAGAVFGAAYGASAYLINVSSCPSWQPPLFIGNQHTC
jgi:hypothetical protein